MNPVLAVPFTGGAGGTVQCEEKRHSAVWAVWPGGEREMTVTVGHADPTPGTLKLVEAELRARLAQLSPPSAF